MSDVNIAQELITLWKTLESKGVTDETSVNAFTASLWAELVVRGLPASEQLSKQMGAALIEMQQLSDTNN